MDKNSAVGIGGSLLAWLSANIDQAGALIVTIITGGYMIHRWYIMARNDKDKNKKKDKKKERKK